MSKITAVTANTERTIVYSDFFTDFSRHINTGQLNKKTNEDAVKQSIRNLLLTDHYERPFHPEIGSNLKALLFENLTPSTVDSIKREVTNVIKKHEPRAILLNVACYPNSDGNAVGVEVTFRIINSTSPTTLDIILQGVR